MSEDVVTQLVLSAERAWALAELVSRLSRNDLGREPSQLGASALTSGTTSPAA